MTACRTLISGLALGLLALLALLLFAPSGSEAATAKKRSKKDPATIYVIRGGGGYFPNLGTVINEKFEEKGLEVVDFRYHERNGAAKQIAKAYRDGDLPHGIILIGYSLGGCGVLEVSRSLQKEEIPVRLLFLIETINPLQTVPANVVECFNLYHFPAILGAPVRADSKETKLTNFEAYTDGGLGLEYSHFAMPFVDKVHDLIAERLLAAIKSPPPKKAATAVASSSRTTTRTAAAPAPAPTTGKKKTGPGEEVSASDAKAEKKTGAFGGLFAKPQAKGEAEISAPAPSTKTKGSR
jgi:thioesterase domain-containing protein